MDVHQEDGFGVDILCEFLEVAIHCILYTRKLYPNGVFQLRKKYNIPVHMCIHPDVTKYIKDVLDSVRFLVKEKSAEQMALVILDKTSAPLEKFVFDISTTDINVQPDQFLFNLEESLRAFLLKLTVADSLLAQDTSECTWVIHVTTKQSTAQKLNNTQLDRGFPWLEAPPNETEIDNPNLVPIRSVKSHLFHLQLYVEERGNV